MEPAFRKAGDEMGYGLFEGAFLRDPGVVWLSRDFYSNTTDNALADDNGSTPVVSVKNLGYSNTKIMY